MRKANSMPRLGIHGTVSASAAAAGAVDGGVLEQEPDERTGGHRGQRVERVAAELPEDERRHSGHREVHGKDCDHWYLRKVRIRLSKVGAGGHSLGSVPTVYQGGTESFPALWPARRASFASLRESFRSLFATGG
jgi:hypothetical protein